MNTHDLLVDAFGRAHEALPELIGQLDAETLARRPGPDANPIGWIVWHLARVQDAQLADLATQLLDGDAEQVWPTEDWHQRIAPQYPVEAHGYGMSSDDVGLLRAQAADLLAYHDKVHTRTLEILEALEQGGMERNLAEVVDESYDPPVTAGVRIVSIVDDISQHLGQVGYVKGLLGA